MLSPAVGSVTPYRAGRRVSTRDTAGEVALLNAER